MGLFSLLKSKPGAGRNTPSPTADEVQLARARARRRLIGAAVLLALGVLGFPLLFESQPRPIPVDIAIDIPNKETAPPLVAPAPRTEAARSEAAKAQAEAAPAEPVEDTAKAAAPASAPPLITAPPKAVAKAEPRVEAKPEVKPSSKPEPKPESKAEPKPEAKPQPKPSAAEAARAKALLEGQAQAKAASADTTAARFVVQVGAFADAGAASDIRAKVEKLGLKTYTQVVDTDGGKRTRVRVGPFGSREEADKAAGRINAAGLQSSVLTL